MDNTQHNFKFMQIGKDVNRTSSVTPALLADGEIALFSTDGTLITASNAADYAKAVVMQGNGTANVEVSDVIVKSEVISAVGSNGSAKVEQISYFGFDGTSSAIDVTNDNSYLLRLIFKSLLSSSNRGELFKYGAYASPLSGTTQVGIANGLVKSLVANFSREADTIIKPEILINSAGLALGTGTATSATIQLNNGSAVVGGFANVDDATTNAAIAVGDYLRIGTAVTDPCYKVIAMDTTNNFLTLDHPYQGTTQTVDDPALERIAAATAAAADCGVKITGVSPTAVIGKFKPQVTRFELTVENDDVTPLTTPTVAYVGNNTAEIVAEREFFYQGNKGAYDRYGRNSFTHTALAANILYDAISIEWQASEAVGGTLQAPRKQLEILIPASRSNDQYTAAASGIKAAFDAFFGITLAL